MAMLAEPRRKQKWTLNPRGKHWSDDSNKFGQKMLEKMGWSNGKGLGANLDGMTEHIRLKFKNDQAGVGFSNDDRDKQWTQHQEGFNELLQQLHNGEAAATPTVENELSGKSLELKSKQSRARVHYQKFTRGKDVNKYSAKDLANIFGKKDLSEKLPELEAVEIEKEPETECLEPIGSSETSHGVITIKGGSITDYFKTKMAVLGRKVELANDSESESETHAGFGFSSSKKKPETPTKSLETHFSFVNPALDAGESKETPRKRRSDFAFENPALEIASPKEMKETPRKRKNEFVFDNPGLELGDVDAVNTPKRRKSDFAFENCALDLNDSQNGGQPAAILSTPEISKKKRKKKAKECIPQADEGFSNAGLNLEAPDDEIASGGHFEVPRICFGLANDALDLTDETNGRKRVTFNETVEYDSVLASGKRKKKKNGGKLDKFEVDNEKMKRKKKKERKEEIAESAFVNEAMDVDPVSQEANDNAANERKSERARKKRERRILNLETIAEAPDEEKETVIEVVTLDESLVGAASENLETLSLDTPKKKKKKRGKSKKLNSTIDISEEDIKLDVEVVVPENEDKKSKKNPDKTRKKKAREEPEITEIQEVKKKKKKKVSSEESKENFVESTTENLEIVESVKKQKKPKKERKDCEEEAAREAEVLETNVQSPWDGKAKKSKKTFKALFARSPVVNFVGSNINDIKGYGVDFK